MRIAARVGVAIVTEYPCLFDGHKKVGYETLSFVRSEGFRAPQGFRGPCDSQVAIVQCSTSSLFLDRGGGFSIEAVLCDTQIVKESMDELSVTTSLLSSQR